MSGSEDGPVNGSVSSRTWPELDPNAGGLHAQWYQANMATDALTIQRCDDCARWCHPARYRCPNCHSSKWSFEPIGANGHLVERTVTYRALHPAFADVVPYAIGVVALAAGPRLFVVVRTDDPMALRPGDAVTVAVNGHGLPFSVLSSTS